MNSLLERLGRFSARRHWIVIIAWLIILGGTLCARRQGGYAGQTVFHAKTGKVSDSNYAVNQATSNVAKLPDVIKAVSPFAFVRFGRGVQGWHDRLLERVLDLGDGKADQYAAPARAENLAGLPPT